MACSGTALPLPFTLLKPSRNSSLRYWLILRIVPISPLFGPLIEDLRGRRFTSDQEVKGAVHAWLAAQPKTFFSEGIKKLVQRWNKCVEKQGDYVEK
jgi:hypothetical protein